MMTINSKVPPSAPVEQGREPREKEPEEMVSLTLAISSIAYKF